MRKIFLILALVAAITAAWTIKSFQPTARAGAAYAAKALCSGVFVSGLHPDRVAAEEYETLDPAFGYLSRRVDVSEKVVETSLLGLGQARAEFNPVSGCTLIADSTLRPSNLVKFTRPTTNLSLLYARGKSGQFDPALDFAFAENEGAQPLNTRAVVVIKNGAVIAERYADEIGPTTPLKGWSMNKTITGLVIGMMIDDGSLKLDGPAPVQSWLGDDDPRRAISIRHLMQMESGLDFNEAYDDLGSDAIKMLFLSSSASGYAERSKLAHEPGTHWAYSSGTSNILAAIAGDVAAAKGQTITDYMWENLLAPARVTTAYLETDQGGDFVGSSYGYMGAHDWGRLGLLMLRGGQGETGRQILSPEWIQFMTEPNRNSGGIYGGQTWLNASAAQGAERTYPGVPDDMFYFGGHDGQFVVVIPSQDLVVVRLGESKFQDMNKHLGELLRRILSTK